MIYSYTISTLSSRGSAVGTNDFAKRRPAVAPSPKRQHSSRSCQQQESAAWSAGVESVLMPRSNARWTRQGHQRHNRNHPNCYQSRMHHINMASLVSIHRTAGQHRAGQPCHNGTHNPMATGPMWQTRRRPWRRPPSQSRHDTSSITLRCIRHPLNHHSTGHRRRSWTHLDHLDRLLPKTK